MSEKDRAIENDPDPESGDVDPEAEIENDDLEAGTGNFVFFSFLSFIPNGDFAVFALETFTDENQFQIYFKKTGIQSVKVSS